MELIRGQLTHLRRFYFHVTRDVNTLGRLQPLEGLRGFAVFLVFLVHYYSLFGSYLPAGSWADQISKVVSNAGNAGVDLFFLLSGYLIYGSLLRKPVSYPAFLAKRARRLYPTFLVVFCIYLLLARKFPIPQLQAGFADSALYILANVLFLPGIFPIKPLIAVAWSLSYEGLFYLIIPLAITFGGLRRYPRSARVVLFLLAITASVAIAPFSGAGHIRLLMFLGGMIFFEIHDSRLFNDTLPRRAEPVIIVAFIGVLLLSAVLQGDQSGLGMVQLASAERQVSRQLLLLISSLALCMYAVQGNGILKAAFTWVPLRWLGTISYSYYLIHGLSIHGLRILLEAIAPAGPHRQAIFWVALPVALAVSLVAAGALFHFVEKPFSLKPAGGRQREISQQECERTL
jgi:exopolysaccharide production protein ExoZ